MITRDSTREERGWSVAPIAAKYNLATAHGPWEGISFLFYFISKQFLVQFRIQRKSFFFLIKYHLIHKLIMSAIFVQPEREREEKQKLKIF
jgi:hypothetical protein